MIFKFSKIKGLESGNKRLRSYLFYALGEIILIVVGILVAIQVDNWSKNRDAALEEKSILVHLSDDLKIAKNQSQELIKIDVRQSKLIKALLNSQKRDSIMKIPKVDSIMYRALWSVENEAPVIQTYSDLKNSGRNLLISNIIIRDKLTSLENDTKNLNTLLMDRFTVQQIRIDKIAENDINFIALLNSYRNFKLDDELQINNYNDIFKNQKISNLFAIKLALTFDVITARNNLNSRIEELIILINSEIMNR